MRKILTYKGIERVLDLIYPPRCPVCNEVVAISDGGVCPECKDKFHYVEEPYCLKCGKPIDDEGEEYCKDCKDKTHNYIEGRACFVYDEYMKESIYRFKYNGKQEYAKYYAREINARLGKKIKSWNVDALIPVPIHKDRLRKRGYNQAELIAKHLSYLTKIPVNNQILERKNPTKALKNLDAKERENNLKKAFIVKENVVKLRTVIIVDDIYTTGSTVDAISLALIDAGVKNVYFITLCIGRGY